MLSLLQNPLLFNVVLRIILVYGFMSGPFAQQSVKAVLFWTFLNNRTILRGGISLTLEEQHELNGFSENTALGFPSFETCFKSCFSGENRKKTRTFLGSP